MSETIMKNSSKDYKELVESLGSLFEMQNEDNQNAFIDYKNYLNYLRTNVPEEYPSHLRMFEESMKRRNEEDEA